MMRWVVVASIDLWQQLEVISVGLVNVPSIVFFWIEALGYNF